MAMCMPVSGRAKTAGVGGMKSSHFEKAEVRRRGSSTHSLLTEAFYVESTQDGDCSLDPSLTFVALVPAADCSPSWESTEERSAGTCRPARRGQMQPFRPPGLTVQMQPLSWGCRVQTCTPPDDVASMPRMAAVQMQPFRPPGPVACAMASWTAKIRGADQASVSRSARSSSPSSSQDLSAQRIYQDLAAVPGFTAGYDSVKRFVRKLGAHTALPDAAHGMCAWSGSPGRLRHRRTGDRSRRQASQDARLSHRARRTPARRTARRRSARRPRTSSVAWRTPSGTSAACPRRS